MPDLQPSSSDRLVLPVAAFATMFVVYLVLFYHIIVQRTVPSDFAVHIEALASMLAGTAYLPHPLFHILTYGTSQLGGTTAESAAVFVMASVLTATAVLQFAIVRAMLGEAARTTNRALVASLFLALTCAIYVPMVNPTIYLGQLSPNVYHNPTYPLMKLFALAALYDAMRILDGDRQPRRFVACILATVASALAKPSFVPLFIASLGLVLGVGALRRRQDGLDWCLVGFFIALASVCTVVLAGQYLATFTPRSAGGMALDASGKNRILVDVFLRHWRTRTPSVAFSVAAALAFPVSVVVFRARSMLASPSGWLAWLVLGFGMAAYAWLIDLTAPGVSNFGWSYMIGQAAVFLASTAEFMRWSAEHRRGSAYLCSATLFALHAVSGMYYFLYVASGRGVW